MRRNTGYKNPKPVAQCFKFLVNVSRFSPCVINLLRNKNICCGVKIVAAQSRARVNFEQQILALLLIFQQTLNLPPTNLL